MARTSLIGQLFKQSSLYSRSLLFFMAIALAGAGGYYFYSQSKLNAATVLTDQNSQTGFQENGLTWELTLGQDGNLYLGNQKLKPEVFHEGNTYRYRYQVINGLTSFVDQVTVVVFLPQAGTEDTIGHRFVNNGGATSTESELIDAQTIKYLANGVDKNSQLAIEFEVPESFVQRSTLTAAKDYVNNLPTSVWLIISIALPIITVLLLIIMAANRMRQTAPAAEVTEEMPSRLPPALLGILINGKITNRELAATLVDLARRGHLIIREVSQNDFRFRRRACDDKLVDFESVLLDQVFGPANEKANTEEISFYLAQELFSKKVSQAFFLAYGKMSHLGYFYVNPLALHRRYQLGGVLLFTLGMIGFFTNLLLINGMQYLLLFWAGMIISAFLVMMFARGIPVRTTLGDRELARWLAFRRYMVDRAPISYTAYSQDKYLAYLPYAIIFECEAEWTRRYYDFPFSQPNWYLAPNISTIEKFANQLFPLLGFLSHALSISAQPVNR